MRELPNGLKVFNGTPHELLFWDPLWDEPIQVEPDATVSARPVERHLAQWLCPRCGGWGRHLLACPDPEGEVVRFVETGFVPREDAELIIDKAFRSGADVIVGSIISARIYPGKVCAPVPVPGYERAEPGEKRFRPDLFVVFTKD